MAELIVLGTASAVPTKDHKNTHFVLVGSETSILVDCVGDDILNLEEAGVELANLNDIVLTHCHPDHISGVPSLLMSLWLMGRKTPLNIYGLEHTLNCIERMMTLYEWEDWPNFFPVVFHRLPDDEMTPVLENQTFRLYASPVCHIIPTIGLRVEVVSTGKALAYSCDTEPCSQVVRLSRGTDFLIHECSGESYGHSSATQAGEIAQEAGVKTLYLIHYSPHLYGDENVLNQVRTGYSGEVQFTKDGMVIQF